jgi:uncharacterized protein
MGDQLSFEKIALEDLKLDSVKLIYPGKISFKLSEKIEAIGLQNFIKESGVS